MDDTNTGSPASGETDWAGKYNGMQRVLGKRTEELNAAQQAAAAHQDRVSELEVELETYRTREAAAREEQALATQYETLRARFEPEPPAPRNPSSQRPARAEEPDPFAQPASRGYPV